MKLGERDHILLRTMHHIVSDGWSEGVFNREFAILYEAVSGRVRSPLEEAGGAICGLRDLAEEKAGRRRAWEEGYEVLEGAIGGDKKGCWSCRGMVCGERRHSYGAGAYRMRDREGRRWRARRRSEPEGMEATVYMSLMAAFGILLWRYSGQEEIVVGTPIANREEPQLEELIGFFVNSLAMRLGVEDGEDYGGVAERGESRDAGGVLDQEVPFERVVEEVAPERSLDGTPIFQVGLAMRNGAEDGAGGGEGTDGGGSAGRGDAGAL